MRGFDTDLYPEGMDRLEIRDLEYVVALSEELSFTRAAARLGIQQPPLSRAVARLERRLGVALFTRTSRSVTLTAAGATLVADARPILDALDTALGNVRMLASTRPCTIALRPATGSGLLHDILARLDDAKHPIDVRVHLTSAPAVAVLEGTADAALTCTTEIPGHLAREELLDQRSVALVHEKHCLARTSELTLADLADRGSAPPRSATSPDLGEGSGGYGSGSSTAARGRGGARGGPRARVVAVADQIFGEAGAVGRVPRGGDLLEDRALLGGETVALGVPGRGQFHHGASAVGL